MTDSEIKLLVNEADRLYDYYKRTLDERKFLIEYYGKMVAAPSGVIGAITTYFLSGSGPKVIPISPTMYALLALISFTIFSAGVALFVTYTLESRNSKNYEIALHKIREGLAKRYQSIDEMVVIQTLRGVSGNVIFSITFWRGAYIVAINSSIFSLFIGLFEQSLTINFFSVSWLASFIAHVLLGAVARNYYINKPSVDEASNA